MTSSSVRTRAFRTVIACSALASCFGYDFAQQARGAPLQAVAPMAQTSPAHIALEKSLDSILGEQANVFASIEGNDLERLRVQLAQIRERLRQSSQQMDQALLVGAWNHKEEKAAAAEIIGRMQGVEILSLMGVATVSGYEYPAHKVPAAAADSTRKLFAVLKELTADVKALNRRVHE
jgi:hypothetical protein